jgi:hypothetical protein
MQTFKTATGRMVSMHPEKAFVNYQLQTQAMSTWARDLGAGGRAYGELIRETGLSLMQGINYDCEGDDKPEDNDGDGVVLLLGCGKPMPGKMKPAAIKSVKQVRLLRLPVLHAAGGVNNLLFAPLNC